MKDHGANALHFPVHPLAPPLVDAALALPRETSRTQAAAANESTTSATGNLVGIAEHKRLLESPHDHQKLEAISRLAGGVAHDFNNILTVIRGYSEFLLESPAANDEMRAAAGAIEEAARRAASLTRQLLTFARRAVVELKLLDLNAVILESQDMLVQLIGQNVQLRVSLAPGQTPVLADRGQIDQVLVDLATNARDAMPAGGRMRIETANVEIVPQDAQAQASIKRGRFVKLVVADNGCGMDDEVKSHLFEPFFTTKKADSGTGLGLATVYGIVKQIGGHVEVHSQPACGASVEVYLPIATSAAHGHGVDHALRSTKGGIETVLVVEDEDDVRAMVVRALQKLGYQVLQAANGAEALRIAECLTSPIALLVTDIVMPGINGRQLGEQLSRQFPSLVVLYTSGCTDNEFIPDGVLNLEAPFLQKPYASAALVAKVRELLDARSAVRPPAAASKSGTSAISP